jgi:hypothetical protein
MEVEGLLPHFWHPATLPYPEPHQPSPHPTDLFKIHFNIILPSTPMSSKWSRSFAFSHQNPRCTSSIPHTCYMPHQCLYSWFYHVYDTWWGVQSIKLIFSFLLSLPVCETQIPSSDPHSWTQSVHILPSVWQTEFYTHTKEQTKL